MCGKKTSGHPNLASNPGPYKYETGAIGRDVRYVELVSSVSTYRWGTECTVGARSPFRRALWSRRVATHLPSPCRHRGTPPSNTGEAAAGNRERMVPWGFRCSGYGTRRYCLCAVRVGTCKQHSVNSFVRIYHTLWELLRFCVSEEHLMDPRLSRLLSHCYNNYLGYHCYIWYHRCICIPLVAMLTSSPVMSALEF
jgi:hypothetical protein